MTSSCTCESGQCAIPKGVNDSRLNLRLTDIFTFKVLTLCFCLTTEQHTGPKALHSSNRPTHHRGCAHVVMSSLSLQCCPFDRTKIIMQSKEAGGLNKNAVQIFCHFNSPDNNVVMAAVRLDGLLNDSGENLLNSTLPIHAEVPFCVPSSIVCHFLDTCN